MNAGVPSGRPCGSKRYAVSPSLNSPIPRGPMVRSVYDRGRRAHGPAKNVCAGHCVSSRPAAGSPKKPTSPYTREKTQRSPPRAPGYSRKLGSSTIEHMRGGPGPAVTRVHSPPSTKHPSMASADRTSRGPTSNMRLRKDSDERMHDTDPPGSRSGANWFRAPVTTMSRSPPRSIVECGGVPAIICALRARDPACLWTGPPGLVLFPPPTPPYHGPGSPD
uniref:Uncharacterized protein n=1 Tax=Human herpesvirus 1 TaxID=10298 RepID=A0A2Z4H4Y5_HHV1|nr:hypothetical protein [Human alphaherpesvirus 1]